MKTPFRLLLLFALALLALTAVEAWAQPLGTFRWQQLPYCNVVTLSVTGQGGAFTLDGFDDQCGAGQRASVVGTAFPNPDGSIGIGLSTVVAPGGAPLHVDAKISLATLHGTWLDSTGKNGALVFTPGAGVGGPPRPTPSRTSTRVFTLTTVDWTPEVLDGRNFRRAVLAVPEVTQAVVDAGSVQAFLQVAVFGQPWTAMPFVLFAGSTTISIGYSLAPGQVVLRVSAADNAGYAPEGVFKVVVTP